MIHLNYGVFYWYIYCEDDLLNIQPVNKRCKRSKAKELHKEIA